MPFTQRGERIFNHIEELDNLLHGGTQGALRKLVQQRWLTRQKLARPVSVLRRRPPQ